MFPNDSDGRIAGTESGLIREASVAGYAYWSGGPRDMMAQGYRITYRTCGARDAADIYKLSADPSRDTYS